MVSLSTIIKPTFINYFQNFIYCIPHVNWCIINNTQINMLKKCLDSFQEEISKGRNNLLIERERLPLQHHYVNLNTYGKSIPILPNIAILNYIGWLNKLQH